jgi:hypothetical protein
MDYRNSTYAMGYPRGASLVLGDRYNAGNHTWARVCASAHEGVCYHEAAIARAVLNPGPGRHIR